MLGIGGVQADLGTATALLHAAASSGDAESQFWLAKLLLNPNSFQPRPQEPASPDVPSPDPIAAIKDQETADAEFARGRAVIRHIRKLQMANRKRAGRPSPPGGPAGGSGASDGSTTEAVMSDPTRPPVVEMNEPLATAWLERAAASGHAPAMVALGNWLLQQRPPRVDAARGWYERAGDAGNTDGLFNLGTLLFEGVRAAGPGGGEAQVLVEARPLEAAAILGRAAAMGDASACFWLGCAKHHGDTEGVERDGAEALELLERAAAGGHAEATLYLSWAHRQGDAALGLPRSEEEADRWLQLAAERGSGAALYELGTVMLSSGRRDDAMATFLASGERGHAEGFTAAGALAYQTATGAGGRGFHTALALYQRGADGGSEQAWRNIAAMYARGEGVARSETYARYILDSVLGGKAPADEPGERA